MWDFHSYVLFMSKPISRNLLYPHVQHVPQLVCSPRTAIARSALPRGEVSSAESKVSSSTDKSCCEKSQKQGAAPPFPWEPLLSWGFVLAFRAAVFPSDPDYCLLAQSWPWFAAPHPGSLAMRWLLLLPWYHARIPCRAASSLPAPYPPSFFFLYFLPGFYIIHAFGWASLDKVVQQIMSGLLDGK